MFKDKKALENIRDLQEYCEVRRLVAYLPSLVELENVIKYEDISNYDPTARYQPSGK